MALSAGFSLVRSSRSSSGPVGCSKVLPGKIWAHRDLPSSVRVSLVPSVCSKVCRLAHGPVHQTEAVTQCGGLHPAGSGCWYQKTRRPLVWAYWFHSLSSSTLEAVSVSSKITKRKQTNKIHGAFQLSPTSLLTFL